jgi:mannose-6-phosphate isomerase-like protein (cupin superfamily)
MALDRYADADALRPEEGEVLTAELVVADDALVKAFALGPGALLDPHEHGDSSNVFHVLRGSPTVIQGDEEERVEAPGVVFHDRGEPHGARNDNEVVAVFTATLAPFPGGG